MIVIYLIRNSLTQSLTYIPYFFHQLFWTQCNPLPTQRVIVGAYSKGVIGESAPINSFASTIESRIIHPRYNVDTWDYDVMLLKISDLVPSTVPRVKLNSDPSKPEILSTVTPLGLGRLAEIDGEFPEVLQEVFVRVIDPTTCNRSPMYQGWIQDSMICAGVANGGQDACKSRFVTLIFRTVKTS